MMNHLYTVSTFLFGLVLFYSCASSDAKEKDVTLNHSDDISESVAITDSSANRTPVQSPIIWNVYQGNIGLYESHVVMEFAINGADVQGSYFYTKHQKTLTLKGNVDTLNNQIILEESYKGKTTGYIRFAMNNSELKGSWSKTKAFEEDENFSASKMNLIGIRRNNFSTEFNRFEYLHEISFFNGEEDELMETTDQLIINNINDQYISFHYDVTGKNAHLGNIEGIAKVDESGTWFYSDDEKCKLKFHLDDQSVRVEVIGDCSTYGGYHAHFGGKLNKVK